VLQEFAPRGFYKAETNQVSGGGGNPRFGPIFEEPAPDEIASAEVRSCALVTDRPGLARSLSAALESRSISCHLVDLAHGFDGATKTLRAVVETAGPIDAVVLAPAADVRTTTSGEAWERVLSEHTGILENIHTDASWARATADYASSDGRRVKLVTLTDAITTGGRSRAQAAAQFARVASGSTEGRVTAYAASIEAPEDDAGEATGELVAHLLSEPEANALAGAELMIGAGRIGLRSHPRPMGSVTFGGPALPDWFDDAVREILGSTDGRRGGT
jgi:hypothetical protein